MSDEQFEPTIGEVYRLCLEIRDQARTTNGRVNELEKGAERIKAFGFFGIIGVGLLVDWARHKLGIS